ncbi:MAG TPA: protein-glutamate O-methyltransferase CheR [Solirubrobacteraceae bacterium]|nr:protein-glutamate O-methyltransferase CheR [Solirubrobacteraceae bacterium]
MGVVQPTRAAGVPKFPASVVPPSSPASPRVDDFTPFCEAVRTICGVDLLQYKRAQMERRIRTWTARRGTEDLGEYARRLRADAAELDAFLDRVTINVSQLWRHPEQWTALATTILPELAERGRVRAWSAGCSYGAEAYTLAAVCREAIPAARVEITGTDLDHRMVARARRGGFTPEDARGAPQRALERYFPGGQATEELRRMVRFATGDLLRMPVPRERYDLVLCRNTVIYFTEAVRDALHVRLVDALRPGGYLVVGASERVADPRGLNLTSPFHFIYRKG